MPKTNFDIFEKSWREEIGKIEKEVIDTRGASLIYTSFGRNRIVLKMSMPKDKFTWDLWIKLNLLESKLIRAVEIARTKYKLQSKSLWVRILESIVGVIMRVPKPEK